MNKRKHVLAISGSTRRNSSNDHLIRAIASSYDDRITIEIYNQIDLLPHFNPDLDNENPPKIVQELREKIKHADGVLFCTPEYVFSLPGALKNVIEWNVSTTLFSRKPTAFIVASASGEKAFESLDLILITIEACIPKGSRLLIQGAKGKLTTAGEISDDNTRENIEKWMRSFLRSMDEQNPTPTKYLES